MSHRINSANEDTTTEPIDVFPEPTPNPNSMKFVVNRILVNEAINFTDSRSAERSPLAAKIFGFPWSSGVYIGPDFITITKQDWVDWETLAEPLAGLLREHFESGDPILSDIKPIEDHTDENEDDTAEVKMIKQLIRDEIRPAVAMDGGDIIFHKYENNNVYIYMQGACAGCPSSTLTLKQGIETRMKEVLPQINEVIAL